MIKTFSFQQIEDRINELSDYLDNRQLKLTDEVNSFDDLYKMYDRINELNQKIGHLRTAFGHSVTEVIDGQQKDISQAAMVSARSPQELVEVANQIRRLKQQLQRNKDEEIKFLSLDKVDDGSTESVPHNAQPTPSSAPDRSASDQGQNRQPASSNPTSNHQPTPDELKAEHDKNFF